LNRLHILRPSPSASYEPLVAWQKCPRSAALYDIFRKDLLGTPVWMEAVGDLETAERRMNALVGRSPGEYFIVWQETGEIVSKTALMFDLTIPKDL
jgi:hypothetical protein